MTYTIYKSDGTPVSIPDGVISTEFYDSTANTGKGLGIGLLGRGFPDYGASIAQNLLQMTENFAGTIIPDDAISLVGQLWFDTNSGDLRVKTIDSGSGITNWETVPLIDQLGNMSLPGDLTVAGTIVGTGSGGNAATASKLQTARTIAATGDATWSVLFDGSANVSGVLTLPTTSVSPGSYGTSTQIPVLTLDAKGRVLNASTTPIGSLPPALITLSGDVNGSGTSTIVTTLSNTGVTAGSYTHADLTIDSKGRISSAISSPTTLTGDVTGSGVGTVSTSLSTTGVTAGSYTTADITVDASGRITAASNGSGGSGPVTLTGDVTGSGTGTVPTTLANSGVTAGTYTYTNLTVDSRGIILAASDGVVNQSLTDPGYSELPGGLLMQWGTKATGISSGSSDTLTFPQAFSATPFSVTLTPYAPTSASTGNGISLAIISSTTSASAVDVHNFGPIPIDGYTFWAVGPA